MVGTYLLPDWVLLCGIILIPCTVAPNAGYWLLVADWTSSLQEENAVIHDLLKNAPF